MSHLNQFMGVFECMPDILKHESFQELPFHFYWKDHDVRFLGANNAQLRTCGFACHSQIIGLRHFDILAPESAKVLDKNDKDILSRELPQLFIEKGSFRNGQVTNTYVSYKMPLLSSQGKKIGIIGISFSIENNEAKLSELPANNQMNHKTQLTARQLDVLYYLVKGLTIKQIARTMTLSAKTVEHYLEIIREKLNCLNRAELITKAFQISAIRKKL
ncbi:MAG: LuxR C-terminal-related transcriptional regulator [Gammaproteobacteria bacterium]|nr:LuxR C-terminal-related transcriptional regulator [Gammaproteobacteria bacterium]